MTILIRKSQACQYIRVKNKIPIPKKSRLMLPFRSQQPKKYRCFVCGRDFTDYDEFREHVIGEHEEGREYVKCPICEAPVRDVRMHVKVKHPGKTLPKKCQMRATVWYDFSGKSRTRKNKKPNHIEGYIVSLKNNGQAMHYRSGYELQVYDCLEELNEVTGYEVEPKDCRTPYYWNGKWRKYWPDLKVQFTDGHTEVWEIKPSNQTDYEQNQRKWDACAKKLGNIGWRFVVKTEQGINNLRRQVNQQDKKPKDD